MRFYVIKLPKFLSFIVCGIMKLFGKMGKEKKA